MSQKDVAKTIVIVLFPFVRLITVVISLEHAQRKERRQLRGLFHSGPIVLWSPLFRLSCLHFPLILFCFVLVLFLPRFGVHSPTLFHPLLPWPNS